MGIIKKIIGAVLGLLAAIGGLVGIGGKGNDGYYIDFSEGQEEAASPAKVASAPVEKAAPAPVPAPAEKVAPAQNEAAANAKAAKAAIKAEKAAAKVAAKEAEAVAKSAEADAAPQAEKDAVAGMTFADMMMIPTNTMAKRTPGPSLAGFQEMAKEMAPKR